MLEVSTYKLILISPTNLLQQIEKNTVKNCKGNYSRDEEEENQ
jgi:hypothetical protein